jgi:hypothetical protein
MTDSPGGLLQVVADINAVGVSAPGRVGGLDVGRPENNTSYCLWIVSDGTLNGTGLVWSKRCWSGGPAPAVQERYPCACDALRHCVLRLTHSVRGEQITCI